MFLEDVMKALAHPARMEMLIWLKDPKEYFGVPKEEAVDGISAGQFERSGLSQSAVSAHLATLPHDRAPTRADWARISTGFRAELDARIAALETLRDSLDGCIGCGCLSLEHCALYNPEDRAAGQGSGPRYLLGDLPPATD